MYPPLLSSHMLSSVLDLIMQILFYLVHLITSYLNFNVSRIHWLALSCRLTVAVHLNQSCISCIGFLSAVGFTSSWPPLSIKLSHHLLQSTFPLYSIPTIQSVLSVQQTSSCWNLLLRAQNLVLVHSAVLPLLFGIKYLSLSDLHPLFLHLKTILKPTTLLTHLPNIPLSVPRIRLRHWHVNIILHLHLHIYRPLHKWPINNKLK